MVTKLINILQSKGSQSKGFRECPTPLGARLGLLHGPILGPHTIRASPNGPPAGPYHRATMTLSLVSHSCQSLHPFAFEVIENRFSYRSCLVWSSCYQFRVSACRLGTEALTRSKDRFYRKQVRTPQVQALFREVSFEHIVESFLWWAIAARITSKSSKPDPLNPFDWDPFDWGMLISFKTCIVGNLFLS